MAKVTKLNRIRNEAVTQELSIKQVELILSGRELSWLGTSRTYRMRENRLTKEKIYNARVTKIKYDDHN